VSRGSGKLSRGGNMTNSLSRSAVDVRWLLESDSLHLVYASQEMKKLLFGKAEVDVDVNLVAKKRRDIVAVRGKKVRKMKGIIQMLKDRRGGVMGQREGGKQIGQREEKKERKGGEGIG